VVTEHGRKSAETRLSMIDLSSRSVQLAPPGSDRVPQILSVGSDFT